MNSLPNVATETGASATTAPRWWVACNWTLRIGAFMCFLGHGAFGIIGKEAWIPYFGVVGISSPTAWSLEPLVGSVDILLAFLVLIRPRPILLVYMTVWAIWTALLRPLSGEPSWEAVERAGNYGVPFAQLLTLGWSTSWRWWLHGPERSPGVPRTLRPLTITLMATTSLLLIGHGMLSVHEKAALIGHYTHISSTHPAVLARTGGGLELALAALVFVWPVSWLAGFIAIWKLATESLFLVAGSSGWELVERGGSYAAPIALALVAAARRGTD